MIFVKYSNHDSPIQYHILITSLLVLENHFKFKVIGDLKYFLRVEIVKYTQATPSQGIIFSITHACAMLIRVILQAPNTPPQASHLPTECSHCLKINKKKQSFTKVEYQISAIITLELFQIQQLSCMFEVVTASIVN
ncbi:hypothetical protein CR513_10170, partial [Mucuna pruriens]